jgi:hypothetical protein
MGLVRSASPPISGSASIGIKGIGVANGDRNDDEYPNILHADRCKAWLMECHGLGDAKVVDLEIIWPDGHRDRFTGVAVKQTVQVIRR